MFDIVNLFIASKRFKDLILNSSSNYKHVFQSLNHACDEKAWDRVLSFSFSIFLNRVKKKLEDDLEIFLYLKFRFYSFFYPIFLYIRFFHLLVSPKELVTRKNLVSVNVKSVLQFIHKFLTMNMFLAISLLITRFYFSVQRIF